MSTPQWVIIGSGYIAREWILAIQSGDHGNITVVARNPRAMSALTAEFPTINTYRIGSDIARTAIANGDFIIVCTSIISTIDIARHVLELRKEHAVILLEKPGFDFSVALSDFTLDPGLAMAGIHVAYNRRFYDGAQRFKSDFQRIYQSSDEMDVRVGISEDFSSIDNEKFPSRVASNWVLANTIHIIDLVTFVMESAGIDFLDAFPPEGVVWGVENRFRIRTRHAVINLTIEARADRPGWYFEAENKLESISLRPLERFSHTTGGQELIKIEAELPKPGYKNMVTRLTLGDLNDFPSFERNLERLLCVQDIFKQPA
tara:strand:- start:253 stop:1203 length:951 start_codon:yes stop_codon:yes gene_type:complete